MPPEKAQELVDVITALLREVVGQEMAKNGVIGKFPENFKPAIDRFQKNLKTLFTELK